MKMADWPDRHIGKHDPVHAGLLGPVKSTQNSLRQLFL
jgi:hypothetical protein